jgi:hypothetical protein
MIDFYESLAWVLFNSWYPLVVVGLPFVNLALFAAAFIIMHTKSTINWSVVAAFFLPFLSYLLLFLACLLLDIRGRQVLSVIPRKQEQEAATVSQFTMSFDSSRNVQFADLHLLDRLYLKEFKQQVNGTR